ncbi:hypothetical protein PVAG01_09084 [Phlyctema vagabunda]|uniref:Uncharacterized protein n=1 Tax=Phlyctema vagabunda TaxID=108571 RepID=A0ABR4P6C4_9HELO
MPVNAGLAVNDASAPATIIRGQLLILHKPPFLQALFDRRETHQKTIEIKHRPETVRISRLRTSQERRQKGLNYPTSKEEDMWVMRRLSDDEECKGGVGDIDETVKSTSNQDAGHAK